MTDTNKTWKKVTLQSQRRLESLLRAEAVAQELRRQFSHHQNSDPMKLHAFLMEWMAVTSSEKRYQTPTLKARRKT